MKTIISIILLAFSFSISAQEQLNILLVIADDCTYQDLPLHGGKNVNTPNIDKLATQGMTFDQAYVAMATCITCRSEMYTGLNPFNNGAQWNHSFTTKGTKSIVHYMNERGYRCGIAGKVHVHPKQNFPFEMVEGVERNCVSNTAKYNSKHIDEFFMRDYQQPYCLVVGFTMPHKPWTVGDISQFDEKEIQLPAYMADTKTAREAYMAYLAEIAELDRQFGLLMTSLEKSGQADNTIVIFTSEQGAQFPFNKWTNYNNGVHTSLIVRWGNKVVANTRTDALVQYQDILPTLLDIIDGKEDSKTPFDGTSFKGVLIGEEDEHRDYAYFLHNNVPEGTPYPIRSVSNGRFHYIRNLNYTSLYTEKHMMGQNKPHNYWSEWMFESAQRPEVFDIVRRFMQRPYEELYDIKNDPDSKHNLIGEKEFESIHHELSKKLDQWLAKHNDQGMKTDTRATFFKNKRLNK